MPINIWTQDQRPQLMMAGTDALARGISEGAGGLSKALADIGKKKKDEASLANVLRKKGALLQPDRKDEFATMSLDELRGEDEAFTVGKALEREAAQQSQRQQQVDIMLRAEAERQRAAEEERAFNRDMSGMGAGVNYNPTPFDPAQGIDTLPNMVSPGDRFDSEAATQQLPYSPPTTPPDRAAMTDVLGTNSQMNLSEVLRAAARHGKLLDPGVHNLSRAIASQGRTTGGPLTFDEDPETGARFARGGNTILPSGTNPAKMNMAGQEIFDADGNLLGHNVPTGGGKFAFRPLKAQASGELMPVLDPSTGQPIPNMGVDATGKVHDFRSNFQKATTGMKTGDAPAGSAPKRRRWNPKTKQLEDAN